MEIYHIYKQITLVSSCIPHSCLPKICRQIYSVLKTKANERFDILLEDKCRLLFFFQNVFTSYHKGKNVIHKISTGNLASSRGASSPGQASLPQLQRSGRTAVRGAERSKVPPRPLSIAVQGTECGPPQSPRPAHPRSLQGPPSQHDPPASLQPAADVKQAA